MSSNILTRLLLDTKDYDSKLGKAKRSSDDFGANIGGKVATAVGKFAAGVGIAMGGVEAFNKTINSSQALGDAWANTLSSCRGTVDAFFRSLAMGDWSAFNGGILTTLTRMREVAALKDTLDDAKLSMGFETRQFESEYARLESMTNDTSLGKAEREAAFASMQKLIADFRAKVEATGAGAAETLVKEMNAKFGKDFTLGDIKKYITEVNNEFLNTETLQRLNDYKATLQDMQGNLYTTMSGGTAGTYTVKNKEVERQIEAFKAQNAELEKMRLLQQDNDEGRKAMVADLEYIEELYKRIAEYEKRGVEQKNKVGAIGAKGGTTKAPEELVAGSLAALDAEIAAAQKVYANAATQAAREAAAKAIDELQRQKGVIELHARVKAPEVGDGKSGSLAALAGGVVYGKIDLNKQIEANGEYKDSILDVVSAVGSLTGSFSAGASTAVSYFSSVVTGVLQASAAIAALIPLKKAEASANAEVAVTGAAASAASTPIVGWLMAGAAVASVIAAMTNIPKFAEGGVVGGSSFVGDKLLARLNSGETVLTQKMAGRALSMIDGGKEVRVSGDVKLNGQDMYIILRNYMLKSGNKL